MKSQRILALIRKEVKKSIRDPAILFMIFLFPIIFVFAFGVSFGGTGSEQPNYKIAIINMDQGEASQIFLNALSNTKILNIQFYLNNQTAQNDLSQGKVQTVMIIPSNFTESFISYNVAPNNPSMWINTSITLYIDKGSLVATQAIPPIIQNSLIAITGQNKQTQLNPFRLKVASFIEVKVPSTFEFMAPGMFTFASIYLIMMVAQSFVQDRENGMMKRIRGTPITSAEFIISQVFSYMIIALVQAVLVFTMIYLLGFRPYVSILVYIFAFLLVLVFSVSNVGFGLITATIAKSSSAATGISFLFVLPQLFLGTFVGTSLSSTAQIVGRFVPSYYVTDALTSLFLRGASITSQIILLDLVVVSTSCAAILIIGILLYGKYFKI